MKLDEKILEVIKQGLPEATVGAFKERMEQLEELANQVEPLKETVVTLKQSLYVITEECSTLKGFKNREESILRSEQDLKDRQTDLKIKEGIHNVRVELMNTRVEDHKQMFATVFKNPTLRTEIFTNKNSNDKQDYNKGTNEINNTTITKSED